MKKISVLFFSIVFYGTFLKAQTPQSFQYQAVVRDASGTAMVNQSVNFQISILSGSVTGTPEYIETHAASTNAFGIVVLSIGTGAVVQGSLSGINWGSNSYFIKVEADPTGGTSYQDMGTTQLLSVPYALYSEKSGNIPVYTGGAGIDVTGTTITNTNPDQPVNLTGTGATFVTGTYPDFTISSTDLNTGTPGGLNKTVQFNNSGIFTGDTSLIWDVVNKRLGVGVTNPSGRMVIQGSATALASDPLFEIKNAAGQQIMAVYNDSIHFFISDLGSNQGGFAVSGRNNAKAFTNNFLLVSPDSTRIYTGDSLAGFGVQNINGGSTTSYLQLTPLNYFIGHQAGDSITTGLYNSFIGFKSGMNNTSGLMNTFMGYQSGMNNEIGQGNVFIGLNSGLNNTSGQINTFVGTESGYSNTSGSNNTFIGSGSGHENVDGSYNTFLGMNSGMSNIAGAANTFLGSLSGLSNTSGNNNLFVGNSTGSFNTIGNNNVFMGPVAGNSNIDGSYNIFIGNGAGYYNTSGTNNIFMGDASGQFNTTGNDNICIGRNTGTSLSGGWRNVFMGVFSGFSTTIGSYNSFYGAETGVQNTSGFNNALFGYRTGANITTGNSNSIYGTESGQADTSGSNNCFFGNQSGYLNENGNDNVYIGFFSGRNSTGSGNIFLGFASGMNETGSNKLYITNSSSDANTSLIYGEFDNNILKFNAKVNVNDVINIAPRTTPPPSPAEGDIYMNSALHKLFVFDGSIWQACW